MLQVEDFVKMRSPVQAVLETMITKPFDCDSNKNSAYMINLFIVEVPLICIPGKQLSFRIFKPDYIVTNPFALHLHSVYTSPFTAMQFRLSNIDSTPRIVSMGYAFYVDAFKKNNINFQSVHVADLTYFGFFLNLNFLGKS